MSSSLGLYALVRIKESNGAIFFFAFSILIQLALSFYFVDCYVSKGQTPGMRIAKIKIIRVSDHQLISIKQAIIREFPGLVSSWLSVIVFSISFVLIFRFVPTGDLEASAIPTYEEINRNFFNIGNWLWLVGIVNYLFILFNRSRRTVTDFIAGTMVVELE